MNLGQLRDHIVRPALRHIELWSPAAENLVLGTALTESRGEFVRQVGGPALGLWQMEPATHDDLWLWINAPGRRLLSEAVRGLESSASISAGAHELIGNLWYGAAMCRVFYRRLRDELPAERDALNMAKLWKLRYNTPLGAGSVPTALPFFKTACGV